MNFRCCLALCINSVHSNLTLRLTNRALMYSASDFLNFVFICWLSCERKPRQAKFDIWSKFDIDVKNYSYLWKLNSEPSPGRKNTPKPQDSSIFRLQICFFVLLTQQIIKNALQVGEPLCVIMICCVSRKKGFLYLNRPWSSRFWFATSAERELIVLYLNRTSSSRLWEA